MVLQAMTLSYSVMFFLYFIDVSLQLTKNVVLCDIVACITSSLFVLFQILSHSIMVCMIHELKYFIHNSKKITTFLNREDGALGVLKNQFF